MNQFGCDWSDIHALSSYLKPILRLVIEILIGPDSVVGWTKLTRFATFWWSCNIMKIMSQFSIHTSLWNTMDSFSEWVQLVLYSCNLPWAKMMWILINRVRVVLIEAVGALQRKNCRWDSAETQAKRKAVFLKIAETRTMAAVTASAAARWRQMYSQSLGSSEPHSWIHCQQLIWNLSNKP